MKLMVYYHNFNRNKIDTFNIFDHFGFRESIEKIIEKYKDKNEFSEILKRELRYYFWSKCEWELVIEVEDNRIFLNPWISSVKPKEIRIDVTDDTDFDWKGFAEKHINKQRYDNVAKIDIYDQLMYVWDDVVSYIWENRKELCYDER